MKTTAALFLFALLAAGVSAAGAEERLIPFDEFYLSVPVTGKLNFDGLRVVVQVRRGVNEPVGRTGIEVVRHVTSIPDRTLTAEELAALMEALNAALKEQPYHREVPRGIYKSVFETLKVNDHTQLRMHRPELGRAVLFEPEVTSKLKLALEQALIAESWLKKLLTERTLPVKTAAAHPPKAADFILTSKLGEVAVEGLGYEVSLTHDRRWQAEPYQVTHEVKYYSHGRAVSMSGGAWVRDMLTEVSHALRAVAKGQKFEATTTQGRRGDGFTVTANLETQRADMTFDGSFTGGLSHYQGSFSKEHLAAIEKLANSGEARAYWFSQHESWFFEKE